VLNTKDNAFGCFLGALAGADSELRPNGKRWTNAGLVSGPLRQIAWRVLDAQYRGLAQRRRRVFMLACDVERGVGGWACARALFPQSESVRGNHPPGGKAGQGIASTLGGGSGGRGWCDDFDQSGAFIVAPPCTQRAYADRASTEDGLVAGTLSAKAAKGSGGPSGDECQNFVATLTAQYAKHGGRTGGKNGGVAENQLIAHTLCGEGHDASGDGTGRGSPLVPLVLRVRRLTPLEFERLQGFPDGHTAIAYRGKPAADGPRYRAIGNSMAVPVVEWIGRRIERFAAVPPRTTVPEGDDTASRRENASEGKIGG
jgi:DNA (cytosine-5)-methyltransferase 1